MAAVPEEKPLSDSGLSCIYCAQTYQPRSLKRRRSIFSEQPIAETDFAQGGHGYARFTETQNSVVKTLKLINAEQQLLVPYQLWSEFFNIAREAFLLRKLYGDENIHLFTPLQGENLHLLKTHNLSKLCQQPDININELVRQTRLVMPKFGQQTFLHYLSTLDFTSFHDRRKAISAIIAVAKALADAHRKEVVHGDVSPSNIMLDTQQEPPIAYVIDLGYGANLNPHEAFHYIELIKGKMPFYFAPERQRPPEKSHYAACTDPQPDIFALCKWIHLLFIGACSRPEGKNYETLKVTVPAFPDYQDSALHTLVCKGYDANPKARPAMQEFISALEAIYLQLPAPSRDTYSACSI
jgi:serine/threonine protein kinase